MTTKQSYHFVGIGGIGMSALARIALEQGHAVTGSDLHPSPLLETLKELGARIHIGHQASHVPEKAIIVFSTDIKTENPELAKGKQEGLPLIHRSELLHELMQSYKPLLVTGTHGKTTTSSLLAHALDGAGLRPGFALGGIPPGFACNGRAAGGEFFVAEADESDGSFLKYQAEGAIITNIDLDHMNHFGSEQNLIDAFGKFARQVKNPRLLFYCGDDSRLNSLELNGISYGFFLSCALRASRYRQEGFKVIFDLEFQGKKYENILFTIPGRHSALNAMAVFGLGLQLGIAEESLRAALNSFSGVGRRSEIKGEVHRILVIDDYGHHPTEIETTLKAIKQAYPIRKLHVVFQPHRYSRTKDALELFGGCFEAADELYVTDIYAAGEEPRTDISSQDVIGQITSQSTVPVRYVQKEAIVDSLYKAVKPLDVVVTLGAGDVTKIGPQFLDRLKTSPVNRLRIGFVYGGKSVEHEISLRSAENVMAAFDPHLFEMSSYLIDKNGNWTVKSIQELQKEEAVFPILHGPNGEDGSIQGMFKILGLPYAGCGPMSSAIAMDKTMTKRLAEAAGLQVAPYVWIPHYRWKQEEEQVIEEILSTLELPLFVKPTHLGSTIGVSRVASQDQLKAAIELSFSVDQEILVEKEIRGRQIEFALFGSSDVTVFPPGEILAEGAVYGYEEKYVTDTIKTTPQAVLSTELIEKGCAFAKRAYEAIACDGYARVDCFLQEDGEYILNEINPIPGFTNASLYPQIAAINGMARGDLVYTLLMIGMERHRSEQRKGL